MFNHKESIHLSTSYAPGTVLCIKTFGKDFTVEKINKGQEY